MNIYHDGEFDQKLYLSGVPNWVFDRDEFKGYVSDINHDCNATAEVDYVHEHGEIDIVYNSDEFVHNCKEVVNPETFGYEDGASTLGITIPEFTAMATHYVNEGVAPLFMMETVEMRSPPVLKYGGKLFQPSYHADSRFSGMRPFLCYINREGQGKREDFICFAEIGQ